jgi:replicative DNA helicase
MYPEVPYSPEAEEALLGSLIVAPGWLSSVSVYLSADDFFLLQHARIFQAMQQIARRRDTIDFVTLAFELRSMKVFDEVGGHSYLMQLVNNTPTSVHAEIYARLIALCAARRQMMQIADEIKNNAVDENMPVEQLFERAETSLMKLRSARQEHGRISMQQAMDQADNTLMERMAIFEANPDYTLGVKTGFKQLDQELDGLPVGITTLAGSTGMGKTACILTMAMNASRNGIDRETQRPASVNLFSGEMTQEQLNWRLLSMKSGVPVKRIARGMMNDHEQGLYLEARNSLINDHALTFESVKRMTVHQIRDTVRELIGRQQLDLLIIDGLLQIDALQISASASKKERGFIMDKRRDAIEYILGELEDITASYDTRVLLTHQISRAPSTRQNKRPVLSDLAEAIFVEQKSSVVLFLYREGYYDSTADPEATEMIIAKNRNGDSPTVPLIFNRQFTRFEDGIRHHVDMSKFD